MKNKTYIIAEIGSNHNGNYDLGKKMILAAKKSGADCVKFQTHITEKEMIKTNITPGKISKKTLWSIIKNCELTEKDEFKIIDLLQEIVGDIKNYELEIRIAKLESKFY